jgi:hypothetical protein
MRHLLASILVRSGTDRMVAFHGVTHCPDCGRFTAGGSRSWRKQDLKQHWKACHE